jgi:hypothetical protein
MDWLYVALGISMAGLGDFAVYQLLNARLSRQVRQGADAVAIEWPALCRTWGLDVECGIDVVNSEGKVVGTALVPAPALN